MKRSIMCVLFPGNSVLYSTVVMEELGRRQDSCANDGPGYRHLFRSGEETKEETHDRLPVGELTFP